MKTFEQIEKELNSLYDDILSESPVNNRDPVYLCAKTMSRLTSDKALINLMKNPTEENFRGMKNAMKSATLNYAEHGFSFDGKLRFSEIQVWMMDHVNAIRMIEALKN